MSAEQDKAVVQRFVEEVMNEGNIHFHTGEMFAVEGRVAHRWTFTGTHEGEMMGVEPTGKKVEVSGVEINHVEDGRISESWTVSDALGLMKQLGAL